MARRWEKCSPGEPDVLDPLGAHRARRRRRRGLARAPLALLASLPLSALPIIVEAAGKVEITTVRTDKGTPAAKPAEDSDEERNCTRELGRRFQGHYGVVWVGNDADSYFPILNTRPPMYVNGTNSNFSQACEDTCADDFQCIKWSYFAERPDIGGTCFFFSAHAEVWGDDPRFVGGLCGPPVEEEDEEEKPEAKDAEDPTQTLHTVQGGSRKVVAAPLAAGAAVAVVAVVLCGASAHVFLRRRRALARQRSLKSTPAGSLDLENQTPVPRNTSDVTPPSWRTGQNACSRVATEKSMFDSEGVSLEQDPPRWGMTVEQLAMFYEHHKQFLEDYCQDHKLDESSMTHVCLRCSCPHDHGHAAHRPAAELPAADVAALPAVTPTMHLVVDLIIKPATAVGGGRLGFAPLFNRQAPLRASIFVSHCWSELFPEFIQTLEKHLPSHAVVWVCSFALPQNGDINRMVSQCELEDSPFAQALMQADRVLVVVDNRILPLERIWCLYEMYLCVSHRIRMDVRAPTMSKSLFRDILKKVERMDICSCKSSSEADRLRILQAVCGSEAKVNSTIKHCLEELVRLMESVED